jgi:hypothetical protein
MTDAVKGDRETGRRLDCANSFDLNQRRQQTSVARWYIFQLKIQIKFWKVLLWKMLVFFRAILSNLRPSGIFYGHLVHFVAIWYIQSRFGMLYREKSGNPAQTRASRLTFSGGRFNKPFTDVLCRKSHQDHVRGFFVQLLYSHNYIDFCPIF